MIFSAAGQDATDSFKAFHSPRAEGMLKKELEQLTVGDLDTTALERSLTPAQKRQADFETEYRALYKTFKERGLMQSR